MKSNKNLLRDVVVCFRSESNGALMALRRDGERCMRAQFFLFVDEEKIFAIEALMPNVLLHCLQTSEKGLLVSDFDVSTRNCEFAASPYCG